MKFALLGLEVRGEWERLPQEERDRRVGMHQRALQELVVRRAAPDEGRIVALSAGLGPVTEAVTLRMRSGRAVMLDGPFAETKEVLGGFDVVDFDSVEAAVEFARKCFTHEGHVSEIRPVHTLWRIDHGPGTANSSTFMVMFVRDETKPLLPSETDARVKLHEDVGTQYVAQKGLLGGEPLGWTGVRLRPAATARTVRIRAGRSIVSDGPYAETKEVLGGFCLIDCATIEEAADWARRLSPHDGDVVEVRPVQSAWWIYRG